MSNVSSGTFDLIFFFPGGGVPADETRRPENASAPNMNAAPTTTPATATKPAIMAVLLFSEDAMYTGQTGHGNGKHPAFPDVPLVYFPAGHV
jgi:hypothetical protein